MATNEQELDQVPPLEVELDEASIMSSLARLYEIHMSVWHSLPVHDNANHTLLITYPSASQPS